MRKAMHIRMTDAAGKGYTWKVESCQGHNYDISRRIRKVSGWMFTSHDGCERFSEGPWASLPVFFHATAENYGLTGNLS